MIESTPGSLTEVRAVGRRVELMTKVAFDGSQPVSAVGFFTYLVREDLWTWSDGVYRLHGYAPRGILPTTDVLLRHKHPDDRSRAAEVLEDAVKGGGAFSCYHRIIDRDEHERSVLSVGRGILGPGGQVERVEGYFVDLTDPRRDETEAEVKRALARVAEHREMIDLAKGMVMLAASCDPAAAFACLARYSQAANLKLHVIAQRLVAACSSGELGSGGVIAFLNDLAPGAQGPGGLGPSRPRTRG